MDPFEHDDGDTNAADAAAQEDLQAEIERQAQSGPEPPEDGDFEVDVSARSPLEEPPPQTREEKKGARYQEIQAARDEEREKRIRAEAELAALRHQQNAPPAPSAPERDPIQDQIEEVYAQKERISTLWNTKSSQNQLSAEEDSQLRKEFQQLEEKGQKLYFQKFKNEEARSRDPREDFVRNIRMQHPDVASNNSYWAWANGEVSKRMAKGEQFDMQMVSDVMDATRREFRLGKYKNAIPDEDHVSRSMAAPRPGSGSSGKNGASSQRVVMTPMMMKIADQALPHIKDRRKRYQHWAATAGKSFLEMEKQAGR